MRKLLALTAIAASTMSPAFTPALACSYMAPLKLQFDAGESHLSKKQVIAIVEFMDSTYAKWPAFDEIQLAAEAYAPVKKEADELARRRLENVVRVVQMRIRDEVRVLKDFQGIPIPKTPDGQSYDYAYLLIRPDVEKLGLPDCNPKPLREGEP